MMLYFNSFSNPTTERIESKDWPVVYMVWGPRSARLYTMCSTPNVNVFTDLIFDPSKMILARGNIPTPGRSNPKTQMRRCNHCCCTQPPWMVTHPSVLEQVVPLGLRQEQQCQGAVGLEDFNLLAILFETTFSVLVSQSLSVKGTMFIDKHQENPRYTNKAALRNHWNSKMLVATKLNCLMHVLSGVRVNHRNIHHEFKRLQTEVSKRKQVQYNMRVDMQKCESLVRWVNIKVITAFTCSKECTAHNPSARHICTFALNQVPQLNMSFVSPQLNAYTMQQKNLRDGSQEITEANCQEVDNQWNYIWSIKRVKLSRNSVWETAISAQRTATAHFRRQVAKLKL